MRTRSILYARMSRATTGNEPTVDAQIAALLEEARRSGEYVDPERDIYVEGLGRHSGYSLKQRPAMRALIERVKSDDSIASFRAFDLERTSRNAEFTLWFVKLLQQYGVTPIILRDPGVGRDDANSIAMLGFRAVAIEFYRNYVRDRKRDAKALAKYHGWIQNTTAPCGLELVGSKQSRRYRVSTRGVWLTDKGVVFGSQDAPPFNSHQPPVFRSYLETVRQVCQMLIDGESMLHTANVLRAERYYWTRHDGTPILVEPHHCQADKLLPILPHYKEFLGSEFIDRAMRRIQARARRASNGRATLEASATPILSRLVHCTVCKHKMVFSYHRSHKEARKFGYYHHHSGMICTEHKYWPRQDIEDKAISQIKAALSRVDGLWDAIQARMGRTETVSRPSKSDRRTTLERQLDNAKRHLVQELLTESDYRQIKREIEAQLAELDKEPETVPMLTPEEIRASFRDLAEWIHKSRMTEPAIFNLRLRDIIDKVWLSPEGAISIEWKPAVARFVQ